MEQYKLKKKKTPSGPNRGFGAYQQRDFRQNDLTFLNSEISHVVKIRLYRRGVQFEEVKVSEKILMQ